MSVVNAAEAVLGKGALAGTFLPASGSINGDGIFREERDSPDRGHAV